MTLDLGKTFSSNKEKAEEGIWEDFGDGAGLLIASSHNKKFQKMFRKIPAGLRAQMNSGSLPDDISRGIMAGIFAETLLLGWKKLSDAGKELTYSKEVAKEFLLKYPLFANFVWEQAEDQSRFRDEEIEEEAKNSKSSSSGS